MSDTLRRVYNAVDLLFDTRAISQESRYSREEGESRLPKTALQAFKKIRPFAYDLDRQARFKKIVSQQGINIGGTSVHWEFFFDLTRRRAKLSCDWVLSWDEGIDDYGPARIEIAVRPFPPENSPIRKAVKEGKLLHRQMMGLWRREYTRLPNLPDKFRDTDIVLADFLKQGLDITQFEFSLHTDLSPQGQLSWIAQTRYDTYYSSFE